MKILTFSTTIILSLIATFVSAKRGIDVGLIAGYSMVSDEYDNKVPEGTFLLKGYVNNTTTGGKVDLAIITNQNETRQTLSNLSGYFEILFPIDDQVIYCYKEGLNESLIDTYKFENRHIVEINFYLRDPEEIIIVTKPVIYMYNAPEEVSLSLKPSCPLTFTYPILDDSWLVTTNSDGTITDTKTDKKYPYLFWEGESKNLDFIGNQGVIEGYIIKTDTCIQFLENTLTLLGLNSKESTDFITFWGPQLIKKEYALIQLLVDERYDEIIASIKVNPEPDQMRRIYMLMAPLDDPDIPFKLVEPQFEKISRNGFTLIEWGGSVLNKKYSS